MGSSYEVGVKLDELTRDLEGARAAIGVCLRHFQWQTTVLSQVEAKARALAPDIGDTAAARELLTLADRARALEAGIRAAIDRIDAVS
jgi:hypothetical protein